MSYLVLARKYRPQKFGDLTGQEITAKILQSALLHQRVASAYLFSGPRGTGKTTTARIFAKALNCQKRVSSLKIEPCDSCDSCLEISNGSSMDILELDAASHTQVEKIREVIIDSVAFSPVKGPHKIFIIDEVHMLSHHSFNALLKTLEEPPAHVVFILATTDFHKIPLTITSRCQRFRFLPLTQKEIFLTLQKIANLEKILVDEESLPLIARAAQGSMRDSLSLFDQIVSHIPSAAAKDPDLASQPSMRIERAKVEEVLGTVREGFLIQFIGELAHKNSKSVLELTAQLLKEGYDLTYFLKELRESFRQMLIEKCGFQDENSIKKIVLPVNEFSLEELLRAIQHLTKCAEQMRWNDLPHIVFECWMVRICQKGLDVEQVMSRLENLEKKIGSPSGKTKIPPLSTPSLASGSFREPSNSKFTIVSSDPPFLSQTVKTEGAVTTVLEKPENNFEQDWKKILETLQQTKPILLQGLEDALAQLKNNHLEILVSNSFRLTMVKRNNNFLEECIEKVLKKKIPIVLKVSEVKIEKKESDPLDANLPGAEEAAPLETDQEMEAFEEPADSELFNLTEDEKKVSVEDEGVKRFMRHFPGKIGKIEKHP